MPYSWATWHTSSMLFLEITVLMLGVISYIVTVHRQLVNLRLLSTPLIDCNVGIYDTGSCLLSTVSC